MDTSDKATADACASVFKAAIRQNWYRLKQDYFVGVPTNEIPATSPLPTCNLLTCGHLQRTRYFLLVCFQVCTYDVYQHLHLLQGVSDQNKRNRARVKWPAATGSRCYVAQLHSYVSVNTLVM